MARAMVQFERNDSGSFVPVGVWYATNQRLQARMVPGSASRDAFMRYVLSDASRPTVPFTTQRGSWEDWIEWGAWSLSDGHIRMMVEVQPELTLDRTFEREVLRQRPTADGLTDEMQAPTVEMPVLTGPKAREWSTGIGGKPK